MHVSTYYTSTAKLTVQVQPWSQPGFKMSFLLPVNDYTFLRDYFPYITVGTCKFNPSMNISQKGSHGKNYLLSSFQKLLLDMTAHIFAGC